MATSFSAPVSASNNPAKRGEFASQRVLFGDHSRYAVAAVHSRFGSVQWFVWDAFQEDAQTGLPAVIRQEDSFEAAVGSL